MVGIFMRPNPSVDGKQLSDPLYDPIWSVCEELDLTIGFHPYLAPDMPGACRNLHLWNYRAPGGSVDFVEAMSQSPVTSLHNIFFSQGLSNVYDMMTTIAIMIGGGVLERHARLRCIFLEANGGWIAPFLERLDHHYEIFGWDVPALKMKPSDYFKRQCWISFDPDESLLKTTAEHPLVGADRIIWASDYPHPDAKIPGVVDELREAMAGLSADKQARILGLNAVELYNLPAVSNLECGGLPPLWGGKGAVFSPHHPAHPKAGASSRTRTTTAPRSPSPRRFLVRAQDQARDADAVHLVGAVVDAARSGRGGTCARAACRR